MDKSVEEKYQLIMENFRAAANNLKTMNQQLNMIAGRQSTKATKKTS